MEPLERNNLKGIHPKAEKCYQSLISLYEELEKRDLPEAFVEKIDPVTRDINSIDLRANSAKSQIQKKRYTVIRLLEKELKIVPKNYYRNLWMVLGMSAMGLPLGIAFGFALDNLAFMGIGLPIGMSIGMAVGASMDEKAKKEGRQLTIDNEFI